MRVSATALGLCTTESRLGREEREALKGEQRAVWQREVGEDSGLDLVKNQKRCKVGSKLEGGDFRSLWDQKFTFLLMEDSWQ